MQDARLDKQDPRLGDLRLASPFERHERSKDSFPIASIQSCSKCSRVLFESFHGQITVTPIIPTAEITRKGAKTLTLGVEDTCFFLFARSVSHARAKENHWEMYYTQETHDCKGESGIPTPKKPIVMKEK